MRITCSSVWEGHKLYCHVIGLPALRAMCVCNQILETGSWGSCETGIRQDKTAIVTVICVNLDLSLLPVWGAPPPREAEQVG